MGKPDTILEKPTNVSKMHRTPKFISARDENENFYLGAYLLRSARSFLDVSPFLWINEPTPAMTPIPLTVATSED